MQYELVRSRRKTLALHIAPDLRITVRAPLRLPQRSIDEFILSRKAWIERTLKTLERRAALDPEPDEGELRALKQLARAYIPGRVSYFSRLSGLVPAGVKITSAKTRHGSCSAKNALCFSCRLMRYPPEAIDYVVVHELCHIVHKHHQKPFYELVASILPDYRARQALLRP